MKIVRNFIIYFLGSALLKGSSLIILPFLLARLSPAELGLLSLVNSFIAITSVLIACGLRQALWLEYYHCNHEQRKKMINDICVLYCLFAVPMLICMAALCSWLNTFIFSNQASLLIIMIALVQCGITFFSELLIQILTYQQKASTVTLLQCSAATIGIIGSCSAVFWWDCGVLGIVMANCCAQIYLALWGFYWYIQKKMHQSLVINIHLELINFYLSLGLPSLPSVLSGWLLASSNRWMLAHYCSLHDVGIYALADMAGSLFQLLILVPLSGSYLPYLFEQFATQSQQLIDVDAWNKKIMIYCMTSVAITASVGYVIFAPIARWLLPLHYHAALPYALMIVIGNIFLMGTYFASAFLQFLKCRWFLSGALSTAAILQIAINLILMPRHAIGGGTIALVTSYIFYFVITLCYNEYIQKNKIFAIQKRNPS